MPDNINLDLAREIASKTLALADEAGSKPVAVAVVDLGGCTVVLERQDGAGRARPGLAVSKAQSCLEFNASCRDLTALFEGRPLLHAVLREATGSPLLPVLGGVLVKNAEGLPIGAVGISGGTLEEEEVFAIKAIAACGLDPDPATTD